MQYTQDAHLPPLGEVARKHRTDYNKEMTGYYKDMTPQALSATLAVDISTIRRWRKRGCPYTESALYSTGRTASRPRYNLLDVLNWIKEQQAEQVNHEESGK